MNIKKLHGLSVCPHEDLGKAITEESIKNLTQLIKKVRNQPALAAIYALEIDRQLNDIGYNSITFSAQFLAKSPIATARVMKLEHLFTEQSKPEIANAIYEAEILAQKGERSNAIAHAFNHAQGAQVNGLNIFYANHTTQRAEIRCYFLNKYLSAFGLNIELKQDVACDFFYRLNSSKPIENKLHRPLVTVIMPAFMAEATIELAVNSLLNQTWHNLQIIIVDDASSDSTLQKAMAIAKRDSRVEILSNPVNVGPYVSRNLGVLHTRGEWLTVHDADDWAFPDRIERQVKAINNASAYICTGQMLRMNADGQITRPVSKNGNTKDGYSRLCFASLMVQTEVFRNQVGVWDSVRVGGDTEMIARLKKLGIKSAHLEQPLMLCLDQVNSLTNTGEFSLDNKNRRSNNFRVKYVDAYTKWHESLCRKRLDIYNFKRDFIIPDALIVDPEKIKIVVENSQLLS
jgi:glycosyltransferase involved in cell wall biosynthesis